jgi:hypothetical protein
MVSQHVDHTILSRLVLRLPGMLISVTVQIALGSRCVKISHSLVQEEEDEVAVEEDEVADDLLEPVESVVMVSFR